MQHPGGKRKPKRMRVSLTLTIHPDLYVESAVRASSLGVSISRVVDLALREWLIAQGAPVPPLIGVG